MEGGSAGRGEGSRQRTEWAAIAKPAPCQADRQGSGMLAPAQPYTTPVDEEGGLGAVKEGSRIEPDHPVNAHEVPEEGVALPNIPRVRQRRLGGKAKALRLKIAPAPD
eukprot:6404861-Heterocapsa_arctica.AAC.1